MHFELRHRQRDESPFSNSLINTTVPICGIANGTDQNTLIKWISDKVVGNFPKNLVHACPFSGRFEVYNMTVEVNPGIKEFVKGIYRAIARFHDGQDDNIHTSIVEVELV